MQERHFLLYNLDIINSHYRRSSIQVGYQGLAAIKIQKYIFHLLNIVTNHPIRYHTIKQIQLEG